ncbi:hypothetical protein GCM10023231_08840 [Olivibacter ginsenosidimutans]|uniref:Fumarate hydratase n=2 Tax=Olivibacter ginsenosidimutans TaxID=1176537 RepID=A0ABP9AMW9_9SPHI
MGMCLFFFAGCKFNPNIQGEGEPYLQGVWVQDSVPNQEQLLTYSLYRFKFTCDSVYITLKTFSKVKTVVDSCFGNGQWDEYAKGVYLVRNDSLLIESTFTHPNWRQKLTGCHRIGQFLPRFKVLKHTEDSLYLESQYYQTPVNVKKIEAITCVPKAR